MKCVSAQVKVKEIASKTEVLARKAIFVKIFVLQGVLAIVWIPRIECHFSGSGLKKGYQFLLPLSLSRVRVQEPLQHTPI